MIFTVINSTFTDNKANEGTAVYYKGTNKNNITITDTIFDSNMHNTEYYEAYGTLNIELKNDNNLNITNSSFTNNTAYQGSAINYKASDRNNITLTNTILHSNGLRGSYIEKGALNIYTDNNTTFSLTNTNFTNNRGMTGSAILYESTNNTWMNIINSTFDNNGKNYCQGPVYQIIKGDSNIRIINSHFTNNKGSSGSAIQLDNNGFGNLIIENSSFVSNGFKGRMYYTYSGGALQLSNVNNTTISNTRFEKNFGFEGGALYYKSESDDTYLTIDNVNFTSNEGSYGGLLNLNKGTVSINNSNFINNQIGQDSDEHYSCTGGAIYSEAKLNINNSNFIGNGLPEEALLTGDAYVNGLVIYQYQNNLTIDNCNFTSNIGITGNYVIDYSAPEEYVLKVNNTIFDNNTCHKKEYKINAPGISLNGNGIIDHTRFSSNKVIIKENKNGEEQYSGVIINTGRGDYSCNITNTEFCENDPENFYINYNYNRIQLRKHSQEFMFDEYIPDYANVTIYLDENEDGTPYKIISKETNNGYLQSVYVENFTADTEKYLIKMVVNQTEDSQYYDQQLFHNNTYYFILPHEYILSVNTTSPVNYEDNTTIKGKAYYTKSTGEEIVFKDKPVDIYINDTYITTVNTDTHGEYEFNYTTTALGTQNVTVKFNTYNLPKITNTTTFNVLIRESVLNIDVNKTRIGKKTNITFTLKDTEDKPISDAFIYFYVNDKMENGTTNENGTLIHQCEIDYTGHSYVKALYDGNYGHTSAVNSTTFTVDTLDTIATITATNTTINKETTISGTLTYDNNKKVANAPIIILINNETINKETDENGEFSFTYPATLIEENHAAIIYEGNDTYMDSYNKTAFHVEKYNTTITVKADNVTLGEKTNITEKLLTRDGQIIANAPIIIYIDDEEINTTTDNKGEFKYEYTTKYPGNNYVEVFYEGNESYKDSINKTTFNVTKIAEAQVNIEVQNNTEGNIEITVTVTDETGAPLSEQKVEITLPNGTTTNMTTDQDGKITMKDNTTQPGEKTVTVTVPSSDNLEGTTETKEITIIPDYQKIIDEMNKTINNLNTTVQEQNKTINDQNKTINDQNKTINNLNKTVQEQQQSINNLNKTVQDQNKTIKDLKDKVEQLEDTIKDKDNTIKGLNDTVQDQKQKIEDLKNTIKNKDNTIKDQNNTINDLKDKVTELEDVVEDLNGKVQELEDTIDSLNKTSTITVIPENGTVDNSKVSVTVANKLGEPISNEPVLIMNSEDIVIGNSTTDENGVAIIPINTLSGTENITVTYPGDKNHSPVNTTLSVTTMKNNVTVSVDPVNGIIGENITLTAHIVDVNGNPVSGGNLVFKLNGKTLRTDERFDSNQTAWKFQVVNGKVTVTLTADLYLRNAKNLTASYSGSYKYNEAKSDTVTAQIKKRDAKLTVTASPTSQKQYNIITFTAKLSDTTHDHSNTTAMSTDTMVIFKINGKTIKDASGKNLMVKVVNNTASYKYTVPQGMGGVTKDGKVRDYSVEAVLVSDIYYPDTRNITNFNVDRSPITINMNKVTLNSKNQLSITGTIKDYKDNNVVGNNTVALKINGKTYLDPITNKTQYFTIADGKIDLSNVQLSSGVTVKNVMLVTGARQAYLGQRAETSDIVKV